MLNAPHSYGSTESRSQTPPNDGFQVHRPSSPVPSGTYDTLVRDKTPSSSSFTCLNILECIGTCVLEVWFILFCVVLLPVVISIFILVCLVPVIERLFHPRREYLDGVSSGFINNIESCVVNCVVEFKQCVDARKLFEEFQDFYIKSERLEFRRWKQRIVRSCCFWPYWEDVLENFDNEYHFQCYDHPIDDAGLQKLVGDFESRPLDLDQPPWQFWHFGKFTNDEGHCSSVCILRIHHAVADGFTLARVLLQAAKPNKPPEGDRQARPARNPNIDASLCQKVRAWFISLRKLVFMRADKPSLLKAAAHMGEWDQRHVVWSSLRTMRVEHLKALARSLGDDTTINDILMTSLASALGRYQRENLNLSSESSPLLECTAATWVSLSPLEHMFADFSDLPLQWGNSTLGCCYLRLPLTQDCITEKLKAMQEQMRNPAAMVEIVLATQLLKCIGWLPKVLSNLLWSSLANKVSLSQSNLLGPQFTFEWFGASVSRMLFVVPPTGTISLFVTIATYDGSVSIGLGGDASAYRRQGLQDIAGDFEEEIASLRKLTSAETGAPF